MQTDHANVKMARWAIMLIRPKMTGMIGYVLNHVSLFIYAEMKSPVQFPVHVVDTLYCIDMFMIMMMLPD